MSKPERPPDSFDVVWAGNDPDLPLRVGDDGSPGWATETHLELDRAWAQARDRAAGLDSEALQPRMRPPPLKPGWRNRASGRVLTIEWTTAHGCSKRHGVVAEVYRTDPGLLYIAEIVHDHRFGDRRRAASGLTWVVMQHPETGGVVEVTEESLEQVWAAKGWELARPGVVPQARWKPEYAEVVRDLLDREDLDHPPLRCRCRCGKEFRLDRRLLLRAAQEATGTRPMTVPVSAVLALS